MEVASSLCRCEINARKLKTRQKKYSVLYQQYALAGLDQPSSHTLNQNPYRLAALSLPYHCMPGTQGTLLKFHGRAVVLVYFPKPAVFLWWYFPNSQLSVYSKIKICLLYDITLKPSAVLWHPSNWFGWFFFFRIYICTHTYSFFPLSFQ